MSFSAEVKDETARQINSARHCQIAELAAIFSMCGSIMISENDAYSIKITTENVLVARKFYKLAKMAFEVDAEIAIHSNNRLNKSNAYTVIIRKNDSAVRILKAFRILDDNMEIDENVMTGSLITQQSCCKRAFIRGAFLASGSISDPNKFYHFEIVCSNEAKAIQLRDMINTFELDSKVVPRKKSFVVYIKEGTQIVEILNIMEAHVALMNLENVRILKEMRNSVNRKVNCETANLNKTVAAAIKQIEDIEYIRDTVGLGSLKEELEELARVRLNNPDMPLKDLGMLLSQPVGKSGVNHRLKKISEIAESLRGSKEE
ncbi:MAG: DNA-binding protein WhiA [Thermoflexaceae bacterium]|nr:DNA-binding protein WhiA [Thermoflexaceae bacterium]